MNNTTKKVLIFGESLCNGLNFDKDLVDQYDQVIIIAVQMI